MNAMKPGMGPPKAPSSKTSKEIVGLLVVLMIMVAFTIIAVANTMKPAAAPAPTTTYTPPSDDDSEIAKTICEVNGGWWRESMFGGEGSCIGADDPTAS